MPNLDFAEPVKPSEIGETIDEQELAKSDAGSQKSEVRSQKSEVRSPKSEVRFCPLSYVHCSLSSVLCYGPHLPRPGGIPCCHFLS
jgi:hypothetical protein